MFNTINAVGINVKNGSYFVVSVLALTGTEHVYNHDGYQK